MLRVARALPLRHHWPPAQAGYQQDGPRRRIPCAGSTCRTLAESLIVRADGYEIAAVETSVKSVDLFDWKPAFPVCLIFGNEVDGISRSCPRVPTRTSAFPCWESSTPECDRGWVVIYELPRKYRRLALGTPGLAIMATNSLTIATPKENRCFLVQNSDRNLNQGDHDGQLSWSEEVFAVKLRGLRTTCLFVAACAAAFGDTLVVPNLQANAPGNQAIPVAATAARFQEIIGGGQFSAPILITGIRFRSAVAAGPCQFQ